ncbi:MAG TPA: MgtC/SapB family protein [Gemmataceae bacterium]|nr:MgtC/SapB family protein [Gemmataceae bacterium]
MLDALTFLENTGAALVLGVAIGLERQFRQHPAGLRTNALVCVGAALFVSLADLLMSLNVPGVDQTRMAGYVVSGIGFLGGGVILREGLTVKGMSTAATLWCVAAVGALAGAGFPLHAAVGTAFVLALNVGLRPIGRWIDARMQYATDVETAYRIRVVCERRQETLVRSILVRHINSHPTMMVHGITTQDAERPDLTVVVVDVFSHSKDDRAVQELMSRINIEPGISAVHWDRSH